ncbi:hypothetical protein KCU81_g877, partial [Aureobasidium melanogenum]
MVERLSRNPISYTGTQYPAVTVVTGNGLSSSSNILAGYILSPTRLCRRSERCTSSSTPQLLRIFDRLSPLLEDRWLRVAVRWDEAPPPFTGRVRFTHAEPLPRSRFTSLRDSAGHHRVMGFAYHIGLTREFITRVHNTTFIMVLAIRQRGMIDPSCRLCIVSEKPLSRLAETKETRNPTASFDLAIPRSSLSLQPLLCSGDAEIRRFG